MNQTYCVDQEILDLVVQGTQLLFGNGHTTFELVGSATIPGIDSPQDVDFLVLAEDSDNNVHSTLAEWRSAGFDDCGDYDAQDLKWGALRKGRLNFIFTCDRGWYERMILAGKLCTKLNLVNKADRIRMHRWVRDGDWSVA